MTTFAKNFSITVNPSTSGPGTGPAIVAPSGGGQSLSHGQVASSSMDVTRDVDPVTGDYEVAVKTLFWSYVSRPGELGNFFGGMTAAFVDQGTYLYDGDVSRVFSQTGLPSCDPANNPVNGSRLGITWFTMGPSVTTPVRWFLYVEEGLDNTEMYAVFNDFSKARGDTFAVTPNLPGRYVIKNETWGSWLDFTADGKGPAGYGLGWIAFRGVQITQSDIGTTPF